MFIKTLKGFSGCVVELHHSHVTKVSSSKQYNDRLERQIKKQIAFTHPYIKTPEVYSTGYTDHGLYYCSMEHIPGKTLSETVTLRPTEYSLSLIKSLLYYIRYNNTLYVDDNKKIYDKINSYEFPDQRLISIQEDILEQIPTQVPISYCHGDLTFENIIVKDDTLYFIDFLDSFIQTRYLDLAKILQDVIYCWSWRYENYQSHIKNIMIYDLIKTTFTKEELDFAHLLLKINILRIYPYTESTDKFYFKIVDYLCTKL
jgi:aminoglycoside phosphotransferase